MDLNWTKHELKWTKMLLKLFKVDQILAKIDQKWTCINLKMNLKNGPKLDQKWTFLCNFRKWTKSRVENLICKKVVIFGSLSLVFLLFQSFFNNEFPIDSSLSKGWRYFFSFKWSKNRNRLLKIPIVRLGKIRSLDFSIMLYTVVENHLRLSHLNSIKIFEFSRQKC